MKRRAGASLAGLWLAATAAWAQDSAGLYQWAEEPTSAIRWECELLLQGDRVTGLPGGRDDLERARGRLRAGLLWDDGDRFEAGAALLLSQSSDSDAASLPNNDNARADHAGLDALWLAWRGAHGRVQVGKRALGLSLTPLLWDSDLRPAGFEFGLDRAAGFDRWSLVGGAWVLEHPLGGDARLQALQGGFHWREGATTSASVLVGLLRFDQLDGLASAGLGRGNGVVQGRYLEDFRLLDLQIGLRRQLAAGTLDLRLDLVRNLGADEARNGARFSAVLGDRFVPGQWEFGYAVQRIQRDAVLAAVNADDWWFHAGARGHMPWVGRGFGDWSLRLAMFLERRDGLDRTTRRLLLDLERRW